ncbi:SEC-C domain-containing protein [Dethiobacter alkaliphilus]|uniref:SEC-C domain-containing protein n=1 Tax=Dethiobacter alkaliphilus TaxID=427926 RepID=UPI002226AF16|nr:SEC-C domain-containing protein [Dethiobacter alkaliphilus]MCW3491338.1 SEC-C domain-containing protein [Dethiobacter alkaliphilus]
METDSQIRIRFIDGFDLVEWMSEFVEIYYFSYEYYKRFGIFPFGERTHGSLGIVQTYQDFLKAKDEVEAYKLMHFIKNRVYRGHHLCPCGSEKMLRKCHGPAMLRFYKDARMKKIMTDDLDAFDRELAE